MKFIFIFGTTLINLLIFGCIGSIEPEEDIYTGPVFTNEYMDSNFDYFLSIYDDQIWIQTNIEVTSCVFIINGVELETEWGNFRSQYEWNCWIQRPSLSYDIDLYPGAVLSVFLSVNDIMIAELIKIPHTLTVDWPELNTEEDYIFEWEIENSPQTHRISFYFEPDENSGNANFENWQISGRKRAHTIPKDYYNSESAGEYRYSILLTAINYIETDRCLITAHSHDWEFYPMYTP